MTKIVIITLLMMSSIASAFLPEPIGSHRRGKIKNAFELPAQTESLVRLFPDKYSGWGSFEMIMMIQNTAVAIKNLYPHSERVRVGDISRRHGGRLSRHASHQNGLDADIIYFRSDSVEEIATRLKNLTKMVVKGTLSPFFDLERNWEYFKLLHIYGSVQRIFVDKEIKRAVCEFAFNKGEHNTFDYVLRSLRPLSNHDDHMHVRLRCPDNAPKCKAQPELDVRETGCEKHWKNIAYNEKTTHTIL
jgi:penicillin-insensitive murein endopeptidase